MHDILLLTNQQDGFKRFISMFEKESYKVNPHTLKDMYYGLINLDLYDMIWIHLYKDIHTTLEDIKYIRKTSKTLIYVFAQKYTYNANSKAKLYDYGATAYVEMPFDEIDLAYHIKAILKHTKIENKCPNVINLGPIHYDLSEQCLLNENQKVQLTRIEHLILEVLLNHQNAIVSKDKLIRIVYDFDKCASDNAIGIHVMRLRKKINRLTSQQLIKTIWASGYKLVPSDSC